MKLKSYLYNSNSNSLGFGKNQSVAWVSEQDYFQLIGSSDLDSQYYVKITSNELLCKFTIYIKLARLNPAAKMEEGYIWIPREIIPERKQVDKGTPLDINVIDIEQIKKAESITIKLKPEEVKKWSEDEIVKAETIFRSKNEVAFIEQRHFIIPMTKDVVMGDVVTIYPQPKNFYEPFRIEKDTLVHFEGLPADKQQTIDFSQIGGLDSIIEKLREVIQIPLICPEYLEKFGVKAPKGILLYGPPGNGKTMIARAVAHSMGTAFQAIEGTEIMSKYYGEAEKELKKKFEEVISRGGGIIFIDEIDSLASIRQADSSEALVSIVATLLTQMDGINSSDRVLVIGATNRINAVDPALRRPGRFDLEFEVPLPGITERKDILNKYIHLEKGECFDSSISDKSLTIIAEQTNGYSGADLKSLYREACMNAIRKCITWNKDTGKLELTKKKEEVFVSYADFENAKKQIVPTSMRELGVNENITPWNQILGLDEFKISIENLNSDLQFLTKKSSIGTRPSFANILLYGEKNTGKQTFVNSFAQKFGYESFSIDLLNLDSISMQEAYRNIESTFQKNSQVEPSILVIHDGETPNKELYLAKIEREIDKINKRACIFVFFLTEHLIQDEKLIVNRLFKIKYNFNLDPKKVKEVLSAKYPSEQIPGYCQIGRCIVDIEEQIALRNRHNENIS